MHFAIVKYVNNSQAFRFEIIFYSSLIVSRKHLLINC